MTRLRTHVMFNAGEADDAIACYVGLFPDSAIESQDRYPADAGALAGRVRLATVRLAGTPIQFFNSPVGHAFGFTPAVSLFIDFDAQAALEAVAATLGDGGSMLMPPANYGFSRWFCWLVDRWGLSWQLNLP